MHPRGAIIQATGWRRRRRRCEHASATCEIKVASRRWIITSPLAGIARVIVIGVSGGLRKWGRKKNAEKEEKREKRGGEKMKREKGDDRLLQLSPFAVSGRRRKLNDREGALKSEARRGKRVIYSPRSPRRWEPRRWTTKATFADYGCARRVNSRRQSADGFRERTRVRFSFVAISLSRWERERERESRVSHFARKKFLYLTLRETTSRFLIFSYGGSGFSCFFGLSSFFFQS